MNEQSMLVTLKRLTAGQYDAAFQMLGACIDRCPESLWTAPVASLKFCQVAFHVLFFADYYLGANEDALRQQPFHREHPEFFRDYEELEFREQVQLYEKPDIMQYLAHCRRKAAEVVAAESAEALAARCNFQRRNHSRAELHVCNIRHVQHHTAQLSLRLRLDAGVEIPWVGSSPI